MTMDIDSSPARLNTFHLFSQLPTELRLKIWSQSLPQTRLIPLRTSSSLSSPPSPSSSPFNFSSSNGCTSPAAIPAALHTCAESRLQAHHEGYDLYFGFARGPGQVIFNPDKDVPYFGPRDGYCAASADFATAMCMIHPAELGTIRRIALSDALFQGQMGGYWSMLAVRATVDAIRLILSRCSDLEEFIFVPHAMEGEEGMDDMITERLARQVQTAMGDLLRKGGYECRDVRWTVLHPRQQFPGFV